MPSEQDALRTWAIRLYKVFCRRGTLGKDEDELPQGETERLALDAAKLLFAARPFESDFHAVDDVQQSWRIFVKPDRVELVRT